MPIHPSLSYPRDITLLRPSDSLERTAEDCATSCLDLHKSHDRTFAHNKVNLETANPKAVSQSTVAHRFQKPLR
jgi:hypothetical protein